MELQDFLSKLDGVRQLPSGFSARCPAHDDHVASLSINDGREGGLVVKCHAGCETADVMAALGLTMRDLAGEPHVVEVYDYVDDNSNLLWSVERWANPKTFRCRPGLPPVADRVLYRADWLRWARENEEAATVYVVEGERDAERLAALGLISTTNVGGAGSWLAHYAQQVKGCHVVIIADNDKPGRAHARDAATNCATEALSVAIVVPRYGKDVSELLDLGWGLDALDPLPEEAELGVVLAANVRTRPHEWAWEGRIPFGGVSMGEGDPGDGKSIWTVDMAARWSSGAPMPDGSHHDGPYDVLMVSAEDDPEATIVPRLRAAGADLGRVHLVTYGTDPARPFTFDEDLTALARYVIRHDIRVLIFDPLMSFISDKTDSHNDHSVRRSLWPLYRLAQDTRAAVLVIRHLNKGSGKAVYRGGGSIAFVGAARAAYTIGRHPDDANKRVLACVKMNIAVLPSALSFSVESTDHGPIVKWHGEIDVDVQTVLDGRRSSESQDIVHFLNTVVEDEPLTWKEIVKYGADVGYSDKMLRSRRNQSRLMKVIGAEGRRSTRWGYLDHATSHLPEAPPSAPHVPHEPIERVGTWQEDGTERQVDDAESPPMYPPFGWADGEDGGQMGRSGQMADDLQDIDIDERREIELHRLPLVCNVCGTEELVNRYAAPWWAVRCLAHSPLTYGG